MGPFEAAMEGSGLGVQTDAADIRAIVAGAIEADHLIEYSGLQIKPGEHLSLKGS